MGVRLNLTNKKMRISNKYIRNEFDFYVTSSHIL